MIQDDLYTKRPAVRVADRYLRNGIMRGAYLFRKPELPGVVPFRYSYNRFYYLAVYPHKGNVWYEGPKRIDVNDAHKDLEAYVDMLAWLRERREDGDI
jgi:hypothetical protein